MLPKIDEMETFINDFQSLRVDMQEQRLKKMGAFINSFQVLRVATQNQRLGEMRVFLSTFEENRSRLLYQKHIKFNVFSLFGVETDEVRHSRFLAWLLDATSDHGQGNVFLRSFVESCRLNIAPNDLDRYRVQTEFSGVESIVDVMVCHRGKFLIYLENKVFAQEGPDQIDREFRDMCRLGSALRIPREQMFAIFLTPDGRRPTSGDATRWRTLSYNKIAREFKKLLPKITAAKVKFILRDWIETISTFGGIQ